MTLFWLIAAFVLAFFLYVLWLHQRRLREQANHDASAVRFEDTSVKRSLNFRKYISETGDFGVMMEIPRASLSNDEYAALTQLLSGLPDAELHALATGRSTDGVLRVDLGRNMDAATQLVASVFTTVFGTAELRVRVRARDICPLDELVDRRDHPRPLDIWRSKFSRKGAQNR
jgi:hypothetical protein